MSNIFISLILLGILVVLVGILAALIRRQKPPVEEKKPPYQPFRGFPFVPDQFKVKDTRLPFPEGPNEITDEQFKARAERECRKLLGPNYVLPRPVETPPEPPKPRQASRKAKRSGPKA